MFSPALLSVPRGVDPRVVYVCMPHSLAQAAHVLFGVDTCAAAGAGTPTRTFFPARKGGNKVEAALYGKSTKRSDLESKEVHGKSDSSMYLV